jgi:hypothetical protein
LRGADRLATLQQAADYKAAEIGGGWLIFAPPEECGR